MPARKKKALVDPRAAGNADAEIGLRIRALRLDRSISQQELGQRLGLSFQQIQKYEKGKNRLTLLRAIEIAKILNCSLDEFVQRAFLRDGVKFNLQRYKLATSFDGLDDNIASVIRNLIDSIKNKE
jgi:transcriptional regulator with XRE-family HTH domain